jgi:DNA polymerase III subunit delta'
MFNALIGNESVKVYLTRALQENRLPQTILFAGPAGIGKSLFAKSLATHLLRKENSPDLHILTPEGKSSLYAVETLREMIDKEHAAPFEAPGKVFILEDIDRMQPVAANALLKTLEEPNPDTTFLLLSSKPQEILPTILSRCVILTFFPLPEQSIGALLHSRGVSPHFAKLAQGSAGRAFELAEMPELEKWRKVLFRLLSEKPPYPEAALRLSKMETEIDQGKEEDPVRTATRIEYLFSCILMWARDQTLKFQKNPPLDLLFFPEEATPAFVPNLQLFEQKVEEARAAYQRNIKLSICLKIALQL